MKSYAVLAATFAGAALAQDMPMPSGDCANLCINNMATIAQTEFQCESSDISCFCTQSNWAYGIRDCTRQACDADQSASAVQWAYARCAGVAATGSGTPAALPILTSAVASATAVQSDGSAVSSAVSGASSAASSAVSGAESITSSLASEVSSAIASASSALASASSSIASDLASITESVGSAASSATDAAGSAASSATDAAGSAASSATEAAGSAASSVAGGAAPKVTGMPILAGAGIAAWLLL
ncbi:hypothetical protein BKA58DRAFT_170363 [Alternaria rosae]|uniref:uncharacterized protein n=1 Tax=Alternaria rosae TaxID=1187941 RepID=UPI001E8ED47C|nr:uncharacterized protein BKA58DRAFT_170363 [Alternaria rosae]KAH6870049.1 hypothetical protein BKA58DRAFT_170363 [Alternaria rosae]